MIRQVMVWSSVVLVVVGGLSALAPLTREQAVERLTVTTPVLISVSGEMPEPYFLQLTRPDALIVILGPRDGSPAPNLLPAAKMPSSR